MGCLKLIEQPQSECGVSKSKMSRQRTGTYRGGGTIPRNFPIIPWAMMAMIGDYNLDFLGWRWKRSIIEERENVCFACTEEVIPSSTR